MKRTVRSWLQYIDRRLDERGRTRLDADDQPAAALRDWLIARRFGQVRNEYSWRSFGNRLWEFERRALRIELVKDRGDWWIEVAAQHEEFREIHLWRDLLDPPEKRDEVLSFTGQAAYLMSRLDRIDEMVFDPLHSADLSLRLKDLAFERSERWWPGTNMRLEESLGTLLTDLGEVTQRGQPPAPIEYARRGVVFAARPDTSVLELRLGDEISEAAMRTPSTGPSARGADWITFSPPEWDKHATDRLEAWVRVAWRFAGDG